MRLSGDLASSLTCLPLRPPAQDDDLPDDVAAVELEYSGEAGVAVSPKAGGEHALPRSLSLPLCLSRCDSGFSMAASSTTEPEAGQGGDVLDSSLEQLPEDITSDQEEKACEGSAKRPEEEEKEKEEEEEEEEEAEVASAKQQFEEKTDEAPLAAGSSVGSAGPSETQEGGDRQLAREKPEDRIWVGGCSSVIAGFYLLTGENHGRPVYEKDAEAKIYFWDDLDDPAWSGWWIGADVGGDEVWAFNPITSTRFPPERGWRLGADGPLDMNILILKAADLEGNSEDSESESDNTSLTDLESFDISIEDWKIDESMGKWSQPPLTQEALRILNEKGPAWSWFSTSNETEETAAATATIEGDGAIGSKEEDTEE